MPCPLAFSLSHPQLCIPYKTRDPPLACYPPHLTSYRLPSLISSAVGCWPCQKFRIISTSEHFTADIHKNGGGRKQPIVSALWFDLNPTQMQHLCCLQGLASQIKAVFKFSTGLKRQVVWSQAERSCRLSGQAFLKNLPPHSCLL